MTETKFSVEGREMVGLSNNISLIFFGGMISLLVVTTFCKVLKMFKNLAKLHRKI
jgi:hypothetical protein